METNKAAEEWLKKLFALGESQLSNLFGTRSDLCDELEKKGIYVIPSSINEKEIISVRNYKTNYFDKEKRETYTKNIKATGLNGIALWKPVWEYLIAQIPNAYVFSGKSLFLQAKQEFVAHNRNETPDFDFYLAGKVPSSPRLLEEFYIGEEEKDKQLQFIKRVPVLFFVLSIIPLVLTINIGNFVGISSFLFILGVLGIVFYFRNRTFKKYFFIPRRKIFENLFPNKRLVTDDIGEYLALGKPVTMIGIDLFKDEQVAALHHKRLIESDLNASYVQLTCFVNLFAKHDNKFHKIVSKKGNYNPILFFEENEVIIIPFEEINDHPIIKYLINNIDILKLDIPKIISEYISKKLKFTDDKIV